MNHSAAILCSAAIFFHRASSSRTRAAKADGAIASGTAPSGSSTAVTSGDAAIALISRFSRSTSAGGVAAGANTPTQISTSKFGAAEAIGARSGNAGCGLLDDSGRVTAVAARTRKLSELAKTVRSKNAGVDLITFDVIFAARETYERVKRAKVLTRESVCALYRIRPERIADFVEFDPGNAIKFTIYRLRPSGSPGDPDIFGAQQYAPLLDVEVPWE
jgi:hypothetical protein